MNIEVKIPAVGESITSGVLSIWHKKDGEIVTRDELLFTLETDKVSQEVTAPDTGILHTSVAEGDEVKIGQTVATIDPAAAPAKPTEPAPEPAKAEKPAEAPKVEKSAPAPKKPEPAPEPSAPASTSSDSRSVRKKLSPLRRKIAAQLVSAQ